MDAETNTLKDKILKLRKELERGYEVRAEQDAKDGIKEKPKASCVAVPAAPVQLAHAAPVQLAPAADVLAEVERRGAELARLLANLAVARQRLDSCHELHTQRALRLRLGSEPGPRADVTVTPMPEGIARITEAGIAAADPMPSTEGTSASEPGGHAKAPETSGVLPGADECSPQKSPRRVQLSGFGPMGEGDDEAMISPRRLMAAAGRRERKDQLAARREYLDQLRAEAERLQAVCSGDSAPSSPPLKGRDGCTLPKGLAFEAAPQSLAGCNGFPAADAFVAPAASPPPPRTSSSSSEASPRSVGPDMRSAVSEGAAPARLSLGPKAKGKAPGPAPKAKSRASLAGYRRTQSDITGGGGGGETPSTRLQPIHWRASLVMKPEDISAMDDPFLGDVVVWLPRWSSERRGRCQAYLSGYERAVGHESQSRSGGRIGNGGGEPALFAPVAASARVPEPPAATGTTCGGEGDGQPQGSPQSSGGSSGPAVGARTRRRTIFSAEMPVEELPERVLQEFFEARAQVAPVPAKAPGKDVRNFLPDQRLRKTLDILLRREAILSRLPQQAGLEFAVDAIVDALKSCSYDRCNSTKLQEIYKIVEEYSKDTDLHNSFIAFVEQHGRAAFVRLENLHMHRLLHGILTIPVIQSRLECMILESMFQDHMEHYRGNLCILQTAFECVLERLSPLRRFFLTALRAGNVLNRDSSAPVSKYGFRLSSLVKFFELKSPQKKELSLLHFVMLWMSTDDVEALCDPGTIDCLNRAKCALSCNVFQDIISQLEGFRQIQLFIASGKYKGKDIPNASPVDNGLSSLSSEPGTTVTTAQKVSQGGDPLSVDNRFHVHMRAFVEESKRSSENLWQLALNMFRSYKDLGAYLNDLQLVYPPPQESKDGEKMDLFAIMHALFSKLAEVRADLRQHTLESEFWNGFHIKPPFFGGELPGAPVARAAAQLPLPRPARVVVELAPAPPPARRPEPPVAQRPAVCVMPEARQELSQTQTKLQLPLASPGPTPQVAPKPPSRPLPSSPPRPPNRAPSTKPSPPHIAVAVQPPEIAKDLPVQPTISEPEVRLEPLALPLHALASPPRRAPRGSGATAKRLSVTVVPEIDDTAGGVAGGSSSSTSMRLFVNRSSSQVLPEAACTVAIPQHTETQATALLASPAASPPSMSPPMPARPFAAPAVPSPTLPTEGPQPKLGPPCRRPAIAKASGALGVAAALGPVPLVPPGRRGLAPPPTASSGSGVLGAPMLDFTGVAGASAPPLGSPLAGSTNLRGPPMPSPMMSLLRSPAGGPPSRSPHASSPRRRGRKSLTRIANRVEAACDMAPMFSPRLQRNVSGEEPKFSPRQQRSGDEDISPCSSVLGRLDLDVSDLIEEDEDEDQPLQASGSQLSAHILQEMRRRRSRGRLSGGGTGCTSMPMFSPGMAPPLGALPSPTLPWPEPDGYGYDSPMSSQAVSFYPLTPVREQGETPYRAEEEDQ